jgi:hypothetical protein
MEPEKVIVRAFGGKPLERLVVERRELKVFICHPETYDACQRGEAFPVGFPRHDVFLFDERLFSRLKSALRRGDGNISNIWAECQPLIEN